MNALWLDRIFKYKHSDKCIESLKKIIELKINRENFLLKQNEFEIQEYSLESVQNIQDLMLTEARSAKNFWKSMQILINPEYKFTSREARGKDIVNKLLDIGFHHLFGVVKKILQSHNVPTEIGLMHTAHRSDSDPLAYDLVEMFRADVVVVELLKFLNLKKKVIEELNQKDIAKFIFRINQRMEKKHYMKDFDKCETYKYYMELQILRIIKAVNHDEIFKPFALPDRHESRCK